ncbi:ankyrin repeat domain-containing protein [Sporobolomyces salmoneus]|uniref:ankyrin repeat domain-containing protein n=1 Tax=Sporobolomyces salmoneus TaxID=183962 RepID=UPI00316B5CC7
MSGLSQEAIAYAQQFFDAARAGAVDILQPPLEAGLPPNLTNSKGDTLVMLAAYHGHIEAVRLLLKHGADPNRLNDRGQSPLSGAIFKNEEAVVEALLDGGADPDIGQPNAVDTAKVFGKTERWEKAFEEARARKGEKAQTT